MLKTWNPACNISIFVGRARGWDSVQRNRVLCGSLFMFFWHPEKGSTNWALLNLCQNNIFLKNPTKLESLMLRNDIIDVYICGLALDICVGDIIIHSISYLFHFIDIACLLLKFVLFHQTRILLTHACCDWMMETAMHSKPFNNK